MLQQLTSTSLYLLVFGFALLLFWLAEGQLNHGRTHSHAGNMVTPERRRPWHFGITGGSICSCMAILLICLFAGLRATSVGSDTQGYPVTFTNAASGYSSFAAFLNDPVGAGDEPLGALLVWICSRFGAGVGPLLFCYQLLTILPVYLAVRRFDGKVPLTIAMAVYLFCFFNNSLNMMRQSVACAFLLLAFSIFLASDRIRISTVILCIAAALFHRSGAYGALLMVLVLLIARINRRSVHLILYLAVALSPMVMTQISTWLIASGVADSHMEYYLDIFVNGTVNQDWFVSPLGSYSLMFLMIYTALVFSPRVLHSYLFEPNRKLASDYRRDSLYQTLRTFNITGYLIYTTLLFSLNTMYGMRFSIFFDFFLILSVPMACRGSLSKQKKILTLLVLIVFWWLWIVRFGWSASALYTFFFEA
jgi:hypothetical protein